MRVAAYLICLGFLFPPIATAELLKGFTAGPDFGEQVRWTTLDFGVRVYVNAPAAKALDAGKPTDVILFATPNGNTIEQTLGGSSPTTSPVDWHFDIQHVLAQVRALRAVETDRNIVLAVTDAPQKSWPAFRKEHPADVPARAAAVAAEALRDVVGSPVRLTVTGHSGGGSFIFAVIEHGDAIPANVNRIAFLDANYSYADATHADKLLAWLRGGEDRYLVVIAYDDREITLNGKKVVGPDGGTYRATHRMLDRFSKDLSFTQSTVGPFEAYRALDGRAQFFIHPNPQNIILHTRLVGEMNGLMEAITIGTPYENKWGTFGGPRAYADYVRPIPATRPSATTTTTTAPIGGKAFVQSLVSLPAPEREAAIAERIAHGGLPPFLTHFKPITIKATLADGKPHEIELEVAPDYLSVGTDADFVRTPLTPKAALPIAASVGCTLPTRKLVDEIDARAEVRLDPAPMTVNRESVDTFLQHNDAIESQRAGKPLGALVTGVKKDVVFTNRLHEKPDRVAIYGWRKLDGKPIQPLTIVHVSWYVDYSHGIRLVRQAVKVDGHPSTVAAVLKDPLLHPLLSDEGVMDVASMYVEPPATRPKDISEKR